MKRGFSIVELSIVLVIIGLLVGGVLVARSMSSSSQISAFISQIQQYDGAVVNYKEEYKYLPGDMPSLTGLSTDGGDGDGILDRTGNSYDDDSMNVFQCEIANFWNNLDPKQFPNHTICHNSDGPNAYSFGSNKNVPLSKLGSNGSIIIASALATDGGVHNRVANSPNYYIVLSGKQPGFTATAGFYGFMVTDSTNSAVKPADMLAVDTKIDDGKADTGNVISGSINNTYSGDGAPVAGGLSTCNLGSTYQIKNNSFECTPMIRIGSLAGSPQ